MSSHQILLHAARHGDYNDQSGAPNNLATLSGRGVEEAQQLAELLAEVPGIEDAVLLCSDLRRAQQTADELAGVINARPQVANWLYYGPEDLAALAAEIDPLDTDQVVLVGHLPMLRTLWEQAGVPGARERLASGGQYHTFALTRGEPRTLEYLQPARRRG